MEFTWAVPASSSMSSIAKPYYHYPQQLPGFNPYLMSHPWTPGYFSMNSYGGSTIMKSRTIVLFVKKSLDIKEAL